MVFAIAGIPMLIWWFGAEAFFSQNQPLPAQVLVIEAWTGTEGVAAAALELKRPGANYDFVVAAGGLAGQSWSKMRWSYPEVAERDLLLAGIAADKIIVASSEDVASQRTYATALAARRALRARGIEPRVINVFTRGSHARRSRLIFAKVFGPNTRVGVISWVPAGYYSGPWWRSSVRADDLIKETVGYLFEVLLNSGRSSDAAPKSPVKMARAISTVRSCASAITPLKSPPPAVI